MSSLDPLANSDRASSPARRRIVILCFAAATLLAADLIVRHAEPLLNTYQINNFDKKYTDVSSRRLPDIMLMGSSRSMYALVPDEFTRATGLEAYNYGISGSKVAEWQLMVKQTFGRRRPRLVVLGVNASEFRADYTQAQAARHLFNWSDLAEAVVHDGPSLDVLGAFAAQKLGPLWATYYRSGELRLWGEEKLAPLLPKHAQFAREVRERVARPLTHDGYVHPWAMGERLKNIEEQFLANPVAFETASVPLFSKEAPAYRRFGEMLYWLRSANIATIVAYVPNSPRTEKRWAIVEPQMIAAIAEVCREHDTSFAPCPQSLVPRTNRDYLDETHVGYDLGLRISRQVVRQSIVMNLIPSVSPTVARADNATETQP